VVDNSDHHDKIYEDKQKAASIAHATNEKVKVAIISIAASAGLTILKLIVGVSTNSLGILSESFILDMIPYGH
jgi:Co/Zn/Cd efflux system component